MQHKKHTEKHHVTKHITRHVGKPVEKKQEVIAVEPPTQEEINFQAKKLRRGLPNA